MANQSIFNAFERMWQHVIAKVGSKADLIHNHDDVYYTETEIDGKLEAVNTSITNITNGDIVVKEAEHATSANSATNATNAVNAQTAENATHAVSANSATTATTAGSAEKATQDASGNVITETYETKTDASAKLAEAKGYTDEKIASIPTPDVSGQINTHNTATDAHNDIRVLINDLRTMLTNFLDVDDETKDQLSEVITLIENNKGTLESLTTSKVNVSDIIDNLTTNSSSKVLSAAQGVAIKALIDALEKELDEHSHEISDIVNLQSNLDDKASKNDLGIITGATSLGDFGTKTVADLQSSLDTWLGSVYDKVNASATFKASDDWITGWNSGNVTSIISNGGYWTVTIVTKYNNSNYMQLKVSNYSDRSVYYVCKYNSQWHNVLKVVFDDELAIHTGNSTAHITAEERTNWNDAVANAAYINATEGESEEDPTPVSISVIDPAGAEESDIGSAADAYKTKVAIDNINEKVGSTDISDIGDGTITGAIGALEESSFITRRRLTSDDDLDTIIEPGIYLFSTKSVPQNCPFSNAGVVEVTRFEDSHIVQRITRVGTDGQSAERVYDSGTWRAWVTRCSPVSLNKALQINPTPTGYTKVGTITIPAKSFYVVSAHASYNNCKPIGVRICGSDEYQDVLAWQEQDVSHNANYIACTFSDYTDIEKTLYLFAQWNSAHNSVSAVYMHGFYIPSV